MKISSYIPELDTLRAFAVLSVMAFHMQKNMTVLHLPLGSYGWVGVDLFFVLSGFLITGILRKSRGDRRYFRNFYARRALRIWPLYSALLLVCFVVLPLGSANLRHEIFTRSAPWPSYLVFLQNWWPRDVFGPLKVTWSLAIEEQFYLLWPPAVWLLSDRRLKHVALAAFLLSSLSRASIAAGWLPFGHYEMTFCHLDGLALGSLLALWLPTADPLRVRRGAFATLALGITLVAALIWKHAPEWALLAPLAIVFASVLCVSINAPLLTRSRMLAFVGKISYGLYLVHVPVFEIVRSQHVRRWFGSNAVLADVLLLVIGFMVAVVVAAASWTLFESPILRLKEKFQPSGLGATEVPALRASTASAS